MGAWQVQLKDEKGTAHTLQLEAGETTTIRQLKQLVNKACFIRSLAGQLLVQRCVACCTSTATALMLSRGS
jgi:hypothetical protein